MGEKRLKYICINCNEEFEINRSQLTMCPYCNCETIEKNKYDKMKQSLEDINYSEEDYNRVLDEEFKVYEKAKDTPLERVIEDIKAMYELIKDPRAALKAKAIAVIALLYVANPIDIIPDALPIFGLVDDAGIVMFAVKSIGDALNQYKEKIKEKLKVKKSNTTVLYQLKQNLDEDQTIGKYKKNLLIWDIPVSKKNNLYANLISGKIINGNEVYLLNNYINTCLIPVNNFDKYISDSIFNEAIVVFKALGVKRIVYTKKTMTTSSKRDIKELRAHNIADLEMCLTLDDTLKEEFTDESVFEKTDLSQSLQNTEFIDKLVWYFSESSIVDESVFRERFENGLLSKKILKDLDYTSILDINDRLGIKKYCDINHNENISLYSKVSWNIEVEYYSLSDIESEKLKLIYNKIIHRIEKRKNELIQYN